MDDTEMKEQILAPPLFYFSKRWGLSFNEAGRGPIFVIRWKRPICVYMCFWRKWFAPRLFLSKEKIELSCDP